MTIVDKSGVGRDTSPRVHVRTHTGLFDDAQRNLSNDTDTNASGTLKDSKTDERPADGLDLVLLWTRFLFRHFKRGGLLSHHRRHRGNGSLAGLAWVESK